MKIIIEIKNCGGCPFFDMNKLKCKEDGISGRYKEGSWKVYYPCNIRPCPIEVK